jgi:hypothetical protein
MSDVFHLFPKLPPELRDMVWRNAVEPDQPGVQIIKPYNPHPSLPDEDLIRLPLYGSDAFQIALHKSEDRQNSFSSPLDRNGGSMGIHQHVLPTPASGLLARNSGVL